MKRSIVNNTAVLILLLFPWQVMAQDVPGQLNQAASAYGTGDLQGTRTALQEALNEINQVIGKEILDLLPATLAGMEKVAAQDNVTGANLGFAGLFVSRFYGSTDKNASIELVSDSPLMAGINALLSLPVFLNKDPNQKRITVKGYKALLTRSTDEAGNVSYDIQLPAGNSLLTFKCTGIPEENAVTGMINSLPLEEIMKKAQ